MPRFFVILEQNQGEPIEPGVDACVRALTSSGIHKANATKAWRRQRGVLLRGLEEAQADAAAAALVAEGIPAIAVADDVYEPAPRTTDVSAIALYDHELFFPGIAVQTQPCSLELSEVRLLLAGVNYDESARSSETLSEIEKQVAGLPLESGVTQTLARRALAEGRFPTFDLSEYLERSAEEQVNFGRMNDGDKELSGRQKRLRRFDAKPAVERFKQSHKNLEAWLVVASDSRAYRITGTTAAFERAGPESIGHWMKPFHALLRGLVERCRFALIPEATRLLHEGSSEGRYVYSDVQAFNEHLMWLWNEVLPSHLDASSSGERA